MNAARRKQIKAIITRLGAVSDLGLEDLKADLEGIRDEEQEAYDNMPEALQAGERGAASEAAVSALDDVISALEEAVNAFDTISEQLEEAAA